jgi:C-terminal processing protease CtpA/Prc
MAGTRGAAAGQGGLGFKFRRLRSGLFEVTALKAGGAAARCGLVMIGDTLLSVDGQPTQGLASSQVADLLLGPRGSLCILELGRSQQRLEVRHLSHV